MARRQNEGIRIVPIIIGPAPGNMRSRLSHCGSAPGRGRPHHIPGRDWSEAQAWVDIVEKSLIGQRRASDLAGSPARSVFAVPPVRTGSPLARIWVYISYRHRDRAMAYSTPQPARRRIRGYAKLVWGRHQDPSWRRRLATDRATHRPSPNHRRHVGATTTSHPIRCRCVAPEVQPALAAHARQELVVLWFSGAPCIRCRHAGAGLWLRPDQSDLPKASRPRNNSMRCVRCTWRCLITSVFRRFQNPRTQSTKWEPPMLLTRILEPSDRKGLQRRGCDDESREVDVVSIHGLGGDA